MRLLRDDSFARSTVEPGRSALRPGVLFALMFVSIALLFLSRLGHPYVEGLRLQLAEILAPALKAAVVPLDPIRRASQRLGDYIDLSRELERLRLENQRLRGLEWRSQENERKLARISRLANVIEEPGLDFVSARVLADASGPFVRTVMLAIGREDGIKPGYPVVDVNGVVGRVIETGTRAARVLLVTDINSRIPVRIGREGRRAVIEGDNGPLPRIAHLPSDVQVEAGDEVFTSGVGGMFPQGLRIGTVMIDGDRLRVTPHAHLDDLEYVSVLLFDSPTIGPAETDGGRAERQLPARRSLLEPPAGKAKARNE